MPGRSTTSAVLSITNIIIMSMVMMYALYIRKAFDSIPYTTPISNGKNKNDWGMSTYCTGYVSFQQEADRCYGW